MQNEACRVLRFVILLGCYVLLRPSEIKGLFLLRILKRSKKKRTPSLKRRRLLQNQALHLTTTGLSLQLFFKSKYISSKQVRRASQSCAEELRPREAARVESKVCPSVRPGHHHSPQEVHRHQSPQHAQGWWGHLQVVGAWLLICLITHALLCRDIDITCEGELIPKDHTLKFVYVTRWRTKDPPLHLVYRWLEDV